MKSFKELLEEKTRIRLTEPGRHIALNMILDGASKLAKNAQVEVAKEHIIAATRAEIAATEKAIELIKSKSGDASKYLTDLKHYTEFLGEQWSESKIRTELEGLLSTMDDSEKIKKNMKNIMLAVMATWEEDIDKIDQKIVNRILASMLT